MEFTLGELADRLGGRTVGDGGRLVTGVASPEAAGPGDLTFVASARALARLEGSKAGCVVLPEDCEAGGRDAILHGSPYAAMAVAIEMFHPAEDTAWGISELAWVHPSAQVGTDIRVGPFAVIDRDTVLGDGARIGSSAHVGAECRIGARSVLHPRAVLYPRTVLGTDCVIHSGAVVGADGFGFTLVAGRHKKIPQVGGVVVGDDVEIGANSCIDAGTLEPTLIGTNTKIDNLVQIGHNCRIGESAVLCGQSGVSGSTVIEDYVVLAGQVGVAGHLRLGKGSQAAAQAAVLQDVAAGEVVAGAPAVPMRLWKRVHVSSQRLPEIRRELKALQERIAELESQLSPG